MGGSVGQWVGSGYITKYQINLDLIEIIQFCSNIYDLLDIFDIFLDILLKPPQPLMGLFFSQSITFFHFNHDSFMNCSQHCYILFFLHFRHNRGPFLLNTLSPFFLNFTFVTAFGKFFLLPHSTTSKCF